MNPERKKKIEQSGFLAGVGIFVGGLTVILMVLVIILLIMKVGSWIV